jgi:hypothetical protein
MEAVTLSGNDSFILNQRVFTDFADGDFAVLDFNGKIVNLSKGKNGNTVYALDLTGDVAMMTLRILRGSSDDQFLLNLWAQQKSNFAGFALMQGEYIKQLGDGQGNILADTYELSGGVFEENVHAKSNVKGEVEQSISIWKFKFSDAPRTMT